MLRAELTRAFISRNFLIALILGLILLGIGIHDYYPGYFTDYAAHQEAIAAGQFDPYIANTFDFFLWARRNFILTYTVPLIVVLPFAASFTSERTSKYLQLIVSRSGRSRYIVSKFVANALAGGMVLALSAIVIYAFLSLILPEGLPVPHPQARIPPQNPFDELYRQDTALFVWTRIGISFIFGLTYASLGMLASLFTENRFIALAAPFIFYIGLTFIMTLLNLVRWMPAAAYNPQLAASSSALTVFGQLGLYFVLSAIGVFVVSKYVLRDI
jgi:hypothetical protein